MGRPIKKKFFGNTNSPYTSGTTGIGGEKLASVALGTAGSGYSQGLTATASAPQVPGGVTATVSVAVNPATGAITGYTVDVAGSGYTTAPTITLVQPNDAVTDATFTTGSADIVVVDATGIYVGMQAASTNITSNQTVEAVVGTTVTLSAVPDGAGTDEEVTFSDEGSLGVAGARALTATQQNAIAGQAFITGGSANAFDIMKQEASKRYLVQTSDGQAQCKLVTTSTLTAGTMNIVATDWNGSTYYVRKLTARKAVLVQSTASTAFLVANGASTGWSLAAATGTVVTIANV